MHVAILGAGLSGLTTAYLLHSHGIHVKLYEARARSGGRIWTKTLAGGARVEAGATWFTQAHTHLAELLGNLGIAHFPQYTDGIGLMASPFEGTVQQFEVPRNEPDSYRIAGGSTALITALANQLPGAAIELNTQIAAIDCAGTNCVLHTTDERKFEADVVVSTLPPRLFCHSISVMPALPNAWREVAASTHTWMGNAVKFFVAYASPFWRSSGYSGMAFSHGGIIPEMYDHTSGDEQDADKRAYALKGFLSPQVYGYSFEARRELVLEQLARYFGSEAKLVLEYGDVLWGNDVSTHVPDQHELMQHQNNGNPVLRQAFFDGKLVMSGSETAAQFPGYMDGAVRAGHHAASLVMAHQRR